MAQLYSGDILPVDAWKILSENPDAKLVDVRTEAEWNFVGIPDLEPISKEVIKIEWRKYPKMEHNENFIAELEKETPNKDIELLLICGVGGRSAEAASYLASEGYTNCYNVIEGFEGDLNTNMQRGKVSGWKAANLPWRQN